MSADSKSDAPEITTATLPRRFAAAIYDLLPVTAILMVATALVMPLTGGAVKPHTPWFQAWLLLACFAYYGWSWRRGGQTIGMKAWRIRVVREDGGALPWPTVALRFAVACIGTVMLGAGLFAALLDARRRMWHDMAARTVVVHEPRPKKKP